MSFPDEAISLHQFLTREECGAVVHRLNAHAEIAIDRNPRMPGSFVTYGRAAYLDVCLPHSSSDRDYYDAIPKTNADLQRVFGELLEHLRERIAYLADEPVEFRPELLALPGIHIFRGPGIRAAGDAGNHFDVQFQKLRLPAPPDPGARPISFTVLLRGPSHGTGLRVHDVTYEEYVRAFEQGRIASLDELVARKSHSYWQYQDGELVLHHGLVVHCLSTPGTPSATDERITLQGHGVRCQGRWILYW
jgi:hypothetical protein